MQSALERIREQNPDFYSKYPTQLLTIADEQVIQSISIQWQLPDEYLYFLRHYVPRSVSWSTDEYINLQIYGADDLVGGQSGYNYNPVKEELITEWPAGYLVIASDEGDPYCIDLSRGDTVIYTAPHGAGTWDFSVVYDNLTEFLHSVLLPRSYEDEDSNMDEDEQYSYNKVFLTGPGSDKVKTLLFIKKVFSCDYTEAKAHLEAVPLTVYKGIDREAAKIVEQLRSIGADYESHRISVNEFLGIP
ncbi:SMI1/KNR4 family protein [Paenibacillus zeisoli]|uniref:SMI1/KNR4 family protein n=2 Tax=Paenibacillus zeisoli TaxID=2496267 RepID=A0A3S1BXB1_9BACL|nr:SMI1/KNR4 family protein [Paenibacillus zeisoli]